MLPQQVNEWISTLKQEDQRNVSSFLETTCGFFQRNSGFFRNSGYYIVGSALSKRTHVYKGKEDWFKARERIKHEVYRESLINQFGEEKMTEYGKAWRRKPANITQEEFQEIEQAIEEASKQIIIRQNQMFARPEYDDIDLVLAGLPRRKANPKLRVWRNFSHLLKAEFPNATHPKLEPWMSPASNGFSYWETYCEHREMVVSDYKLEIPLSNQLTKIHFMLFDSDERFGSAHGNKEDFSDHWPNKDVSRNMWKKLQEDRRLQFLPIIEF